VNFKLQSSAVLLCAGLGLAASAQAAEPGWYIVGFGGESSATGLSQAEMDDNLAELLASGGLDILDATSTLDDSDTGFGLAGGYQLNDHFAFEFAYVDLGSVDYRSTGTVTDGTDDFASDVSLGTSASGPVVSALGILPIGERFSVFGRVGLSLLNTDGTARVAIDGQSQRLTQSSQKSDPMFGVGAEFAIGKYYAVRLTWDRYMDVGTEDVTGDADADLIALGIRMQLDWFR
jgi:OmpA-OmpF porin, OOP family